MGWGERGGLRDQEYRLENADFRREPAAEITELEVRKSPLKSALSLTLCVNSDHSPPLERFHAFSQSKMNVRLNDVFRFSLALKL